jgi:hypothetical protein
MTHAAPFAGDERSVLLDATALVLADLTGNRDSYEAMIGTYRGADSYEVLRLATAVAASAVSTLRNAGEACGQDPGSFLTAAALLIRIAL